ncbi:MAG: ribonuclease HI family protein [Planctomycetota bacterium]
MIKELEIYIDGASRGNPGPSGVGILIKDTQDSTILIQRGEYIGETTNNVAEYTALIRALGIIIGKTFNSAFGGKPESLTLIINADSKLIINQVAGNYRIKSPNLVPLAVKARQLMKKFKSVSLNLIDRKDNKIADRLANKAMNLRDIVDELDSNIMFNHDVASG